MDNQKNQPVQVAHLSDTHLGLEAYRALTPGGDNLRALDIVRAFANVVDDIVSWDPAIVIHSGDAFDRPSIPTRYLLFFSQQLEKLAAIRPDGTRRQVVIISGNHDQPRSRKEVCALELFANLPGVRVVTTSWAKIDFPTAGQGADHPASELADVCVTAIPHDTLKGLDLGEIYPRAGWRDVLTTHAVAAGSDLYQRCLGREYAVPQEMLSKPWSYVALGHYHKQGPVSLGSLFSTVGSQQSENSNVGRIWYAGSTENCSFRDLRDNGEQRGYLRVTLPPSVDDLPDVVRTYLPIRAMFRLPTLDASALNPEQIQEKLILRIQAAAISGACVGQIITGLSRQMWSVVNINAIKSAASSAMYYELIPNYDNEDISNNTRKAGLLGDLPAALIASAQARLAPSQIEPALELARKLLGAALLKLSAEEQGTVSSFAQDEQLGQLPNSLDEQLRSSEHLSPANSPALAASSSPAVAASRIGRDGKKTKPISVKSVVA